MATLRECTTGGVGKLDSGPDFDADAPPPTMPPPTPIGTEECDRCNEKRDTVMSRNPLSRSAQPSDMREACS